jgi:hypothetical protein
MLRMTVRDTDTQAAREQRACRLSASGAILAREVDAYLSFWVAAAEPPEPARQVPVWVQTQLDEPPEFQW